MRHWQDRELDVLLRMMDTSCASMARARIMERKGDGAASAAERLIRWYKAIGDGYHADSVSQAALAIAADQIVRSKVLMTAAMPAIDLGRLDDARSFIKQSRSLIDIVVRSDLHARLLANSAYVHFRSGALDSAETDARASLRISERLSDTLQIIQAKSTLAGIATTKNDMGACLGLQNELIAFGNEFDFPSIVAANAFNRGNSYKSMKRYAEALKDYEMAWHAAQQCGKHDLAAIARGARAILWNDMDTISLVRTNTFSLMRDSSISELRLAIDAMRSLGSALWEANFTLTLAEHFNWTGQPDSAMTWYAHALRMAEAMENPQFELYARQGIGTGAYFNSDYKSAIAQWERAIALNEQLGLPEHAALTWDRLHFAYERTGNLPKALAALRKAKAIGLELYSDSVTQAAAQLEASFKYEKKLFTDSVQHASELKSVDDQRTIAELKATRNSTAAWGIGTAALLALGGGAFAWRTQRKRRDAEAGKAIAQANERTAEERRKAAEFQNAALRAQMDEHFISNTLNVVNAHLYTDDLTPLATCSRAWHACGACWRTASTPSVPLRADLEALKTSWNCNDCGSTANSNTAFRWRGHGYRPHSSAAVSSARALAENAIEHGVGSMQSGGRIKLEAAMREGALVLSVEDNGVGRKESTERNARGHKKTSLSMRIIGDQLELLRERTGRAAELRTIDLPQGTRVEVMLPI
ncbi:MAG: hypothetical protein IPJ85_05860 [Flavobacteriales bacterium]|nr:hypothetical protein [Flavobacteriales bacterium]